MRVKYQRLLRTLRDIASDQNKEYQRVSAPSHGVPHATYKPVTEAPLMLTSARFLLMLDHD